MITWKKRIERDRGFIVLEFELECPLEPQQLPALLEAVPAGPCPHGVVLSGRGPIWLYCALAHYFHPSQWVAVYDPRLGGAVVVQSHTRRWRVGEIVPL